MADGVQWEGQGEHDMQVRGTLADELGKYLDLTANQMKLTAGNIANVDTPGYKAKEIDFEREFASQMNGGGEPVIRDVDGLVARPDGNTVSLDRESMALAKTQLQFRMGVEMLKHEFNQSLSAIHADAK